MKLINKDTVKLIITAAVLAGGLVFTGCSALQSSLSSEQEKSLTEATGVSYLDGKTWYYNGKSDSNMKASTIPLSQDYQNQSLKICFTKQVAASQLSGSITVNYKDAEGCAVTKVFNSIKGSFTDNFKAYKVDMSDVVALFDRSANVDGEASVNLKLTGFVCAEGEQKGRPLSAVDEKGIKIRPLYSDFNVDFSTAGMSSESKIEFDVNSPVSIEGGEYTVSGTATNGKEYSFEVNANGSTVYLGLKNGFDFTDITALKTELDGTDVALDLQNILPATCGDSYSKTINVHFTKYSIVIDGKKDVNFTEAKGAVVAADTIKDQDAFADLKYDVAAQTDIQEVAVQSDDDYLYIGVSGNFGLTWNNALVILVSNGKVTGANGASLTKFSGADSEVFAAKAGSRTKVQPNVYIAHQPGMNNDGTGKLAASAYVAGANTDIAANVLCNPMGCTEETNLTYLEYAIPLADAGFAAGEEVSIIVASSLQWDEGKAIVDCAPDTGIKTYNDNNHTDVVYDFGNGIKYTIK